MIEYACRVEPGIRESNDDRAFINGSLVRDGMVSGSTRLPVFAAVCDGCGGYSGGGRAADLTLQTFQGNSAEDYIDPEVLSQAMMKCEDRIWMEKKQVPEYQEMCTTIAGCVLSEEKVILFHAGDTRIYRYDGKYFAQMTKDHSRVQNEMDMGLITPEDAAGREDRGVITRCIGVGGDKPDIREIGFGIQKGDLYLICSDGLWEYLSEEEMVEILSADMNLSEKADRLVDRALEIGSDDNISVCLCMNGGIENG